MYNASKVVSSGSSILNEVTMFCSVCGQYTALPSDEMTMAGYLELIRSIHLK